MLKRNTIVCILLSILLLFGSCGRIEVVETKKEAIQIADNYVKIKYLNKFKDYKVRVELIDETWVVAYAPQDATEYITGGGGPAVEIEKLTGKVVSCYLQK